MNILIVDSDSEWSDLLEERLRRGNTLVRTGLGKEAIAKLGTQDFDLVIADSVLPDAGEFDVLKVARSATPPVEVIMVVQRSTVGAAVRSMHLGAADYQQKPFPIDDLCERVERLAKQRTRSETRFKIAAQVAEQLAGNLVCESPAMHEALVAARQVAKTDATVLLTGKSGTGKTQLARFIHFASLRSPGPLVEVHCAALPETLLESELFGYEKGAFTGAATAKSGHFVAAHEGTLFLDEIGDVTYSAQVKLLRFLQEREVMPVGSTRSLKVDVRVIAATHRDLEASVQSGAFREDLLYRFSVFPIRLPDLSERREDILPLADHILADKGQPKERLGKKARAELLAHTWPGNIREMENRIMRALIVAGDDTIEPSHLQLPVGSSAAPRRAATDLLTQGFNLDQLERQILFAALERAQGNKTAAAKLLGITRRRLYSRLEILGEGVEAASSEESVEADTDA